LTDEPKTTEETVTVDPVAPATTTETIQATTETPAPVTAAVVERIEGKPHVRVHFSLITWLGNEYVELKTALGNFLVPHSHFVAVIPAHGTVDSSAVVVADTITSQLPK
jgi:hypothetical protein